MLTSNRTIGANGTRNGLTASRHNAARTASRAAGTTNGLAVEVSAISPDKTLHAGDKRFSVEAYSIGCMSVTRQWIVLGRGNV